MEPDERRTQDWKEFKAAAGDTLLDRDATIRLARHLMVKWCTNSGGMEEVLLVGVTSGELPKEILSDWKCRLDAPTSQQAALVVTESTEADSRGNDPDVINAPRDEMGPAEPPQALRQHEELIRECSRKQGDVAVQMGRRLIDARATCSRTNYRWKDFLNRLKIRYGIVPQTCYDYIKYAEWDMPPNLGSSIMRWIVYGFPRDDAGTRKMIMDAAENNLTLDQLKAIYGKIRNGHVPTEARPPKNELPPAAGKERRPGPLTPQEEREALLKEQEALLKSRGVIDGRLGQIKESLCELGVDPDKQDLE